MSTPTTRRDVAAPPASPRRRARPYTLAGRLAWAGVTWIGAWAILLVLLFDVLLSSVLHGQVDQALRTRAQAVAATVEVRGDRIVVTGPDVDDALDAGTSIYQGSQLVEGVDLGAELKQALLQRGRTTTDRETTAVRYLAEPLTAPTDPSRQVGTVVVSSGLGAADSTSRVIALSSLGFVALLLASTFLALRITIGRALRPVSLMGGQAAAWSDRDTDRRFDPDQGPSELRDLAGSLNAVLERVDAALRHERAFNAELSHELRTPLAHLHAEINLMAGAARNGPSPQPVTAEELDELLESVRRLERLVEAALVPARAESNHGLPGRCLAREALTALHPPAGSAITLQLDGALDAVLAVDAALVRRAVAPVLDNAFRYAKTTVVVDVTVDSGQHLAAIIVSDDGDALPPDLTEQMFEPGFRGHTPDPHPGAGLGLALSRRICRAAGGDTAAITGDGWTRITLTFPRL